MAVRPAAVFPLSRAAGEGDTADEGTSLEFTVCEARTLFRPHPQPLSHCVGEGCRGARRCALQRVPPLPQAGEEDTADKGTSLEFTVCEARTLFRPHPQPLSHKVGEGCRGEWLFALPLFSPSPARRERGTQLIRVHRLSSLCARRARFFALTPSPSPTLWERGVGAHGGAPCSAFPLSRLRERGTKGVRAIQRTCRFTLALGKIAPASKTSCRTVVPLPGGTQGVRTKERACLAATAHGKIAPTPEILYLTAVPLSGVGVRARCLSLYAKTLISRNQSSRVQ
jgi:hypothetical protein